MNVTAFADIREEFLKRAQRIVWCTMATVDAKGRPRSRILHPLWEDATGWIATGRHTLKEKHLQKTPYVSISYWDQQHEQIHVECKAEWADSPHEKRRVWELFKNTPPPLGYDPGLFWPGGPDDPTYGVLKLTPWRIELWSLNDLINRKPSQVWRP